MVMQDGSAERRDPERRRPGGQCRSTNQKSYRHLGDAVTLAGKSNTLQCLPRKNKEAGSSEQTLKMSEQRST